MLEPSTGRRLRSSAIAVLVVLRPYLFLTPGLLILGGLLGAVLILLRYSFNGYESDGGMYDGWMLESYRRFFTDPYYYKVILNTLRIAGITTLVTLLMAFPVAYYWSITKYKALVLILIVGSLFMDVLLRTYGWIVILASRGFINQILKGLGIIDKPLKLLFTDTSVIAELSTEVMVFAILPMAAVLLRMDPTLKDAAASLGASKLQTFIRITLPQIIPGIFGATVLVFALCVSAYIAPLLLGGGQVTMIAMEIDSEIGVLLNWPLGAVESIVVVLLVLSLLYIWRKGLNRLQPGGTRG